MALQTTGAISLSDVNVELSNAATETISLNDAVVRTLFGAASGAISLSDGYGKGAQALSGKLYFPNAVTETSVY